MINTGIKIVGTGMYVPETIATNDDFAKIVDTSDEWITSRTGIKKRHIANGEPTWFMGVKAAEKALEAAKIDAKDIDLILFTTISADYYYPAMASMVQAKIGARSIPTFDIHCACAGFVYALDMARNYLNTGNYNNVLIVSAENLTKQTDYSDRSTCILFGDGAGAAVVKATEGEFYSHFGTEGQGAHTLFIYDDEPGNIFTKGEKLHEFYQFSEWPKGKVYMDGREVYKFAIRVLSESVTDVCRQANITPHEIDWVIPHQANIRIMDGAAKKLHLSMDKFIVNIDQYGNTSSASIPIALDEAYKRGNIRKGQTICMTGFGAGLTYGSVLFKW